METISDIYSCNLSPSAPSIRGHNEKYSFNLRSISHFVLGVCVRREELSYDKENILSGQKWLLSYANVVVNRHAEMSQKVFDKLQGQI